MIRYIFVLGDAELASLVVRLRAEHVTRLAIDVEGENNLHSYGIHVALIQLFDGRLGAIVDPLTIRDRRSLKDLLEKAPWVLVWFDSANDLLSFQHALDIRPSPIRDLAIAARMLGRRGGLHDMTNQPGSSSPKIPGYNRMPRDRQRFARVLWHAREMYGKAHDLPPGNVASKQDMRAIIDRNLRDPQAITRFLNENRKRNHVDARDFGERLAEAEAKASADLSRQGPGREGSPREASRSRGDR